MTGNSVDFCQVCYTFSYFLNEVLKIKNINCLKHNQKLAVYFTATMCRSDFDCDNSNCEYCMSSGFCRQYESDYCKAFTCGVGDGDCDSGQCYPGLICGRNNFLEYHLLPTHCANGNIRNKEVCYEKGMISYFIFVSFHYYINSFPWIYILSSWNTSFIPFLACKTDSDCDYSNCEYCLSNGHCSKFSGEYCDNFPCGVGDGDCDPGTCPSGLLCRYNNFLKYHPLLSNCSSGKIKDNEVCIKKGISFNLKYTKPPNTVYIYIIY